MMRSRVRSARVVGQAIAAASRPPRAWLQMSTATIYADTRGTPNDDVTGVIGGSEEGVPGYWAFSVDIAQAWERELDEAKVPATRKVALRAAMVMTPDRGGCSTCCRAWRAWDWAARSPAAGSTCHGSTRTTSPPRSASSLTRTSWPAGQPRPPRASAAA